MKTGLIYKIWHPEFPNKVYIGQTMQSEFPRRWSQHKTAADKREKSESTKGKNVKLHQAISICRPVESWEHEVLGVHHHEIKNGLKNKLYERENHFIG